MKPVGGSAPLALSGDDQGQDLCGLDAQPAVLAAGAARGLKDFGSAVSVIGPYQSDGGWVLRSWGQANGDVLTRYIQANIEGIRWALNPANKAAMVAILADRLKLSNEVAAESFTFSQNGFAADGKFDLDGFKNSLKLRAEMLGTWGGTPPAPDKYLDFTLLPARARQHVARCIRQRDEMKTVLAFGAGALHGACPPSRSAADVAEVRDRSRLWPETAAEQLGAWPGGSREASRSGERDHVWIGSARAACRGWRPPLRNRRASSALLCRHAAVRIEFDRGRQRSCRPGAAKALAATGPSAGSVASGSRKGPRLVRRQPQGRWLSAQVHPRREVRACRSASPVRARRDNDTTQLRPARRLLDRCGSERKLYVADGYGNHRVIVFDAATGAYRRHWGAYGKRPADESQPDLERSGAPALRPRRRRSRRRLTTRYTA
mgnify:CR=1 FL=1